MARNNHRNPTVGSADFTPIGSQIASVIRDVARRGFAVHPSDWRLAQRADHWDEDGSHFLSSRRSRSSEGAEKREEEEMTGRSRIVRSRIRREFPIHSSDSSLTRPDDRPLRRGRLPPISFPLGEVEAAREQREKKQKKWPGD